MWFSGMSEGPCPFSPPIPPFIQGMGIGLALSPDGVNWEHHTGPQQDGWLLSRNTDQWWSFDTSYTTIGHMLYDANSVVKADAGTYMMYYTGGDSEVVDMNGMKYRGLRARIGVAISKDGEHFSRIEGDFPNGAILDLGSPGDFDAFLVGEPTVLRMEKGDANERYVMFYFSYDAISGRCSVGRAVSKDGFLFRKTNPDGEARSADDATPRKVATVTGSCEKGRFDEIGVRRTSIVKREDGTYVMFIEVLDATRKSRIGMCESKDTKRWSDIKLLLDVGQTGSWDCENVSHPNAVLMRDGSARLYYVGTGEDDEATKGRGSSIGMAVSNGKDWTKFTRIQK